MSDPKDQDLAGYVAGLDLSDQGEPDAAPARTATPASAVVVRRNDSKDAYARIEQAVRAREADIVATLAPGINPTWFINVALQAVTKQPRLLECTPASIIKSLRDAAEVGLAVLGARRQGYLVPFRNKQGQYEAQFIPGYGGLISLAVGSGLVKSVDAAMVRERDSFSYAYGTGKYLRHIPFLNLTDERGPDTVDQRGDVVRGKPLDGGRYVAAYAIAVLDSGAEQFMVRDVGFIDGIRKRSKAADSGPWVTDYEWMGAKTMVRQLFKILPGSLMPTQFMRALELEDEAESNAAAPNVAVTAPARQALAAIVSGDDDQDDA